MKIKVIKSGNHYGYIHDGDVVDAIKKPGTNEVSAYDSEGILWTIFDYIEVKDEKNDNPMKTIRDILGQDIKIIEFK